MASHCRGLTDADPSTGLKFQEVHSPDSEKREGAGLGGISPYLGRLKQEAHESEAALRLCLKNK